MLALSRRKALLSLALIGAFVLCTLMMNIVPAFAAGGQMGMLSGTVVDAGNTAVANADILLTAPTGRYRAHTDAKGKFKILGADVDTYTVTVQKDGFLKVMEPGVAVLGDQTTDLGTITLQKSS
jgi:hypothetical protein